MPKGAGCLGIDWADIDAKFRTLAPNSLNSRQVDASLAVIHDFRNAANVADLIGLLR